MDVAVGEGGGSGAGREEEIWLETGWSAWVEGAVEGEVASGHAWRWCWGCGWQRVRGVEDVVWLGCAKVGAPGVG